jgi:hypothetical protein
MLRVLSHLNYKAWFALGEFVDNAIQSHNSADSDSPLTIDIDIDLNAESQIVIRDNAAGIRREDFDRAFKPASAPPDASGLSEFGMGMKSAAYWFADQWEVETTAAGSNRLYSVEFDVNAITSSNLDSVEIRSTEAPIESHFTVVRLRQVRHVPVGRTVGKIKDHLRDIYREFLDYGNIKLRVNGQELRHEYPPILMAPVFTEPQGTERSWRVDFDFEIADGRRASGFAALRDPGSTKNTGFSLFRRGRIIQGSGDEGYMPSSIFGGGNSYESQRLFGDIHLHGFGVSHTKDGFQWGQDEELFLARLKEAIDTEEMPLLRQARHFRKYEYGRSSRRNLQQAIERATGEMETALPTSLPTILANATTEPHSLPSAVADTNPSISREIIFRQAGLDWRVAVESSTSVGAADWFSRSVERAAGSISLRVQLNMSHPFVIRFCQKESESLEAVIRLAIAIAVGEVSARLAGVANAQAVVRSLNTVVSTTLSGK